MIQEVKPKEVGPDDECPICFEPLLDPNSTDQEDLIFCRTGCGNPVHESCMRTYAKAIQDTVRCVLCRSPWVFPNEPIQGDNEDESGIDARRGLLMDGQLIDLSVIARNSFLHGRPNYSRRSRTRVQEDEEDGDDDDYTESQYGMTESQSEKSVRQRSERAERALKRSQANAASSAGPSNQPSRTTRSSSKRAPAVEKRVSKRVQAKQNSVSTRMTRTASKAASSGAHGTPLRRSARSRLDVDIFSPEDV